jgi:hypothetical protein
MKKTIASILAASALAVAGAASAQASIDDRVDRLEDRVDRGVDQNLITENQADILRNQLQGVRDQRDRLENNGEWNDARRRDLDFRLDRLAYRLGREEYFTRYGTFRGYYRNWDAENDSGSADREPSSPY